MQIVARIVEALVMMSFSVALRVVRTFVAFSVCTGRDMASSTTGGVVLTVVSPDTTEPPAT